MMAENEQTENTLRSSYREKIDDRKNEIFRLIDDTTVYVQNVLNNTSRIKQNVLKEFFHPYKGDFLIIDANTEKIDVAISLLNQEIRKNKYRGTDEISFILKERYAILHKKLILRLEKRQVKKKTRNVILLFTIILFHILIYGWLTIIVR